MRPRGKSGANGTSNIDPPQPEGEAITRLSNPERLPILGRRTEDELPAAGSGLQPTSQPGQDNPGSFMELSPAEEGDRLDDPYNTTASNHSPTAPVQGLSNSSILETIWISAMPTITAPRVKEV